MAFSKKDAALRLDELNTVEIPFLDQLKKLKWNVNQLPDEEQDESLLKWGRDSFKEVILQDILEGQLQKINPFLKGQQDQIHQVVRKITDDLPDDLLSANEEVLGLLLDNTRIKENRESGDSNPVVRYIDFENPENNHFLAISQFKVQVPGTDKHIKPDIVLFINGLPIAVVECKSLKVDDAIPEAIDQMKRYADTRKEATEPEGNPRLFFYNQLMIGTCRNEAKYGTITSQEEHFYPWFDPWPYSVNDIPHSVRTSPHNQDRLIYGMLSRENILRLIQSFTVFKKNEKGQKIKVVARHQQFRAVAEVKSRLLTKNTPEERGGIIWHTQGSGKSLTMMFLVREMYRHEQLKQWKVVFVTDRTQLEDQLAKTSESIGFEVKSSNSIEDLKLKLRNSNSDLVMAMIHKFQEKDKIALGIDKEGAEEKLHTDDDKVKLFDLLNSSEKILVMIDEAHRSQYKLLGANLNRALPNATKLAFTGTPIDKTEETFQYYIHKYTLRDARRDKVIVDIVYEGKTNQPNISDREAMNAQFVNVFQDYEPDQWQQIVGYSSRRAYLEAKETIKAKAVDMIDHYVDQVLPNGFKAQVVTVSKEAAVRYKDFLEEAISLKKEWLKENEPEYQDWDKLDRLEVGVIFSGTHNDLPHIKRYSEDKKYKEECEASFKLPFGVSEDGVNGDVGLLVVVDMLLTGFDAPVEQVMYLDKKIIAHNLLQAIARTNRLYPGKSCGFVVDYIGIGDHLTAALDTFKNKEDLEEILGVMEQKQANYDALVNAHEMLWQVFREAGIDDIADIDAIFDIFYDEKIRFDFILKFRDFAKYLDRVYPSAQALDYESDYRKFSAVLELAKRHFRDHRMSMKGVPNKLRAITDQYLESIGIDQKVAPISIMDEKFEDQVGKRKMKKTKAAEIEHAIRHFINVQADTDPELMASFSDLLDQIFEEYANNWERIYEELERLRQKIRETMKEEDKLGLDRKKEVPFYHTLKTELFGAIDAKISEDQLSQLVYLTRDISFVVIKEINLTDFWDKAAAKSRLKKDVIEEFLKYVKQQPKEIQVQLLAKREAIATKILEKAKNNHYSLTNAA